MISGEGEQMVEDPDGNPITQKVGPGCAVFVPESRFHSTLNTAARQCSSSSSIRRLDREGAARIAGLPDRPLEGHHTSGK